MTIYDIAKIKCRTFIESINTLFSMGSELEQEVDGIETSIGTSDDEASSSGSLWARIKYALANMVATSGAQTIADVKTFSSSPVIPTTPDTTTSAVNQAYVESTVDGVNNLLHKSGDETKTGFLRLLQGTNLLYIKSSSTDFDDSTVPSISLKDSYLCNMQDVNGVTVGVDYIRFTQEGVKFWERYTYFTDGNGVVQHPYIRLELTATGKKVTKCSYRDSTVLSEYSDSEIVTIGTLKKLGIIQ